MEYRDKLTGKTLEFTPKPDQMVVKFSPQGDVATAGRDLRDRRVMSPMHEAHHWGVYELMSEAADVEAAADVLAGRPDVQATLPVLVDGDGNERYFLPGEVTVQFGEDIPDERRREIVASLGAEVLEEHHTPGYYTLALPESKDVFEAIDDLNQHQEVEFAEPSNVGFDDALFIPTDPDFSRQWYLHNVGQTGGTFDADVDAPSGWDLERGDPGVVIAVLDTGVDLTHPDLQNNLVPQPPGEDWDFADPDLVPAPGPELFGDHGTHCAGIAAAADNGSGMVGLAPGCRILPIRIDLHGGRVQNRIDAIHFVRSIAHRFDRLVMSCSWKTGGDIAAMRHAVAQADAAGILVCFAAGNDGQDTAAHPVYPGVYPESFSVAATDHDDVRASFSTFGSTVDIAAPGVAIYSTLPGNAHGVKSGTSMACPLVAGLAGLVWSRNTGLTNAEVRKIIQQTAEDIGPNNPGFDGKLGAGRINAARALRKTQAPCRFRVLGKIPYPQANAGSSSALSLYLEPYWRLPIWRPKKRRLKKALLFLTQQAGSERIYFLHPETGAVLRSILPQGQNTVGSMTWDGHGIRVANVTTGAGEIHSIDPSSGAVLHSIPAPPGRGEGLTHDGRSLYYSTISRIHEVDGSNGTVLRSFPVPGGGRCRALADDGRSLVFAGDQSGEVVVFEKTSLKVVCRFAVPGGSDNPVEGLAYDPSTRVLYIAHQGDETIYWGRLV